MIAIDPRFGAPPERCPVCGKVPYTKPEAMAAHGRLVAGGAARVQVYRCKGGKGHQAQWHVGHERRKPRTRR